MSDKVTENTDLNTSEGEGKNTESVTGGGDSTANGKVEKTLTQIEVDKIVKQAKLDAKAAAKREFEESLKDKVVLTADELATKRTEWEAEYKKSAAIASAKASIKATYELTEEQVARLIGDTAEELQADAEKIYGALKKKVAPKLPTGSKTDTTDDDVIGKALKDLVSSKRK